MRKTKILVFLLCITIIFTNLSGCGFISKKEIKPTGVSTPVKKKNYVKHTSTYAYKNLTATQKRCYNEMISLLSDVDSVSNISQDNKYIIPRLTVTDISVTEADLNFSFEAMLSDHPEIFWVSGEWKFFISEKYFTIDFSSYFPRDEVKKMVKKVDKKVKNIIDTIPDYYSDYEIELHLHDYLIDNCKYYKPYTDVDYSGNVYDALIEGKTICTGYTKAFQYLLNCVGIHCVSIKGIGEGTSHIWNSVLLDDNWYYVDVTWDDSLSLGRYNYFNINENQLLADHTIYDYFEGVNCNVIKVDCNSNEFNYFKRSAFELKDLEKNSLSEELATWYLNKESALYIYINPDFLDYDDTVDKLLNDYYLSNGIKKANKNYDLNISYEINYLLAKQVNGFIITLK